MVGQQLGGVRLERNVERRAVGKHALGRDDGDLADLQELLIDLQLGETGGVRNERVEPLAGQPLEIALRLLEMLRSKEQAFRPHDAVVLGHMRRWSTTVPPQRKPASKLGA